MLTCLRICGITEGVSLLVLLFVAMPIKYIGGDPSWVRFVGSLHGFLFILFIVCLTVTAPKLKLSWPVVGIGYLCSTVPFACFYFDQKYLKPLDKKRAV